MATIVSSFYNHKIGKSETVLTPKHPKMTMGSVRKYIDNYLPVEYRTVDGKDSLNIMLIDADVVINSLYGMTKKPHHEEL